MVQLRRALPIAALFISISLFNYCFSSNNDDGRSLPPTQPAATSQLSARVTNDMFDEINQKLYGPETYATGNCALCGCPYSKESCPPHYSTDGIQESVQFFDAHRDVIAPLVEEQIAVRALEAMEQCGAAKILKRGGWCLEAGNNPNNRVKITFGKDGANHSFNIPQHHVPPPQNMVSTLLDLIQKENVTSINDFGAGVGQYKDQVNQHAPHVVHRAYDGAGNIGHYTHGFVDFFDLTFPLALEKADWVLSLEVGEHVPSKYEGMLLRNLHHHNCKGVILSWGIIAQGGNGHINLHSSEYIIDKFQRLGYSYDEHWTKLFRRGEGNYGWFTASTLVFRRNTPVC